MKCDHEPKLDTIKPEKDYPGISAAECKKCGTGYHVKQDVTGWVTATFKDLAASKAKR